MKLLSLFLLLLIYDSYGQVCFSDVQFHRGPNSLPSSGVFCVVKSNEQFVYDEIETMETIEQFQDMGILTDIEDNQTPREVLQLIDADGKLFPFSIYASVWGPKCFGTQEIMIGQTTTVECLPEWLVFNKTECEQNVLLSVDSYVNVSFATIHDKKLSSLRPRLDENSAVRRIVWENNECQNVVKELTLSLVIIENEIVDIVASSIIYANLNTNNFNSMTHKISIVFVDSDIDNSTSIGYSDGQRIQVTKGNGELDVLSIPTIGSCLEQNTREVEFNTQVDSSCTISVDRCSEAQQQINNFLDSQIADSVLSENSVDGKTIAIVRKNTTTTEVNNDDHCVLVTQTSVEIAYARQGSEQAYYNVIVGILYKFDPVEINLNDNKVLTLSFHVRFRDVSSVPTSLFATIPHFNLRLPADFFFPFIETYSDSYRSNIYMFTLISVILVCL